MSNEYQFVSTDTEALVASLIAGYERITGVTVQPSSPERLFVLWVADTIVQARAQINYAGNQNIPSRAQGANLDALGELFYDQDRPAAQAATCTVRFHISEAQLSAILVPAGTRVTDASSTLFWETTADVYIGIGDTYADATVRCLTVGMTGNGYAIGQLNTLVDLFAYFDHCANITASDGGADEATDAEYYELMRSSEDAYSTAGPLGAYVYWAKSVSTDIADVKAIRPKAAISKTLTVYAKHAFLGGVDLDTDSLCVFPRGSSTAAVLNTDYEIDYTDNLLTITLLTGGALSSATQIDITVDDLMAGRVSLFALMNDGTIASDTIKELIAAACSSDEARPLTDSLSVDDPEIVSYNITFTYFIPTDTTLSASEIQAAVEAAVAEYKAWQSGRLGRDINPSKLISLLMETGIKRVALTAPTFTALRDGKDNTTPQVAAVGATSITNGGYENE